MMDKRDRLRAIDQADVFEDKKFWTVSILLWSVSAIGVCILMVMLGNLNIPGVQTTLDFSTPGRYMILAALIGMLTALYNIGKAMWGGFPWLKS